MKVLVINAGSSSLKYQLLDPDTKDVLAKGLCERIGIDGHIKHTPPAVMCTTQTVTCPTTRPPSSWSWRS